MRVAIGVCQFLVVACYALHAAHGQSFVDCTVTTTTPLSNPDNWEKYSILFKDGNVKLVIQRKQGHSSLYEDDTSVSSYDLYRPGVSVSKDVDLTEINLHKIHGHFSLAEVGSNKQVTIASWRWSLEAASSQFNSPSPYKVDLKCPEMNDSTSK